MKKDANGEFIFVVDGLEYDSEDITHIGEPDEDIGGKFEKVYSGEPYVADEIEVSDWGKLVLSLYPIKDDAGEIVGFVGVDYDVESEYNSLRDLRSNIIVIVLLATGVASVIAIFVSRRITKPIVKATELINKIAELDISHDDGYSELTKNSDETGVMAKSLLEMRDRLGEIVKSIKISSDEMDNSAASLSVVSQQMAATTDTISGAIQEVAVGTGTQASDFINITEIIGDFSVKLEEMVSSISDIDKSARQIQKEASKGSIDMSCLSGSLESIEKTFFDFVSKIDSFGEKLSHVSAITDIINGISTQTGLLSLNASIESARAGEAGRGFAVVADEIRNLSIQSKDSADKIKGLIDGVTEEAELMIKMSDTMNSELKNQAGVINTAMDSFGGIVKGVEMTVPKIEAVGSAAAVIQNEKNLIIEKIECASSVAQEVSASSEEIASSSQEMSSSAEEVASSASVLSSMVGEMTVQMEKFVL